MGRRLFSHGEHLFELLTLIRTHPVTFPAIAVQRFHRACKGYLKCMDDLAILPKPKDHFLQHMSDRAAWLGAPALYGCWKDESLNRLLRDVAAGSHGLIHEKRILCDFPKAYAADEAKKRRRVE